MKDSQLLQPYECGSVEEDQLIANEKSLNTKEKNDHPSWSRYIDPEMVPVKLLYLCWGGLIGTYIMYLNPFLVSIGLPKGKTGAITGIGYVLSSFSGPLWGLVTDHTGKPKVVLFVLCICAAMSVGSLPFIAALLSDSDVIQTCANQSSRATFNMPIGNSSNITNYAQSMNGVNSERNSTKGNCAGEFSNTLFYTFLVIMPLGAIFYNNIQNYIDATALKVIKVSRRGATYGAQRIFGAIGASASIFMTGFLVEKFQFEGLSNFSMAFFVFVPFAVFVIPMTWLLMSQYDRNMEEQQTTATLTSTITMENTKEEEEMLQNEENSNGVVQLLCEMCTQFEVIVLMTTALVAGASFHLFIYFTMFLILDKMDVSVSEAGFVFSGLNVANIIMFPFTGIIIKFLRGPQLAIVIALLAHCARNVIMSYTDTYWVMLAAQALHCFDFALFWSAMMDYVHEISHREIVTTMIMIFQSVHFGFSPFLMNVAGGILYQMYGGERLFFGGGVVCGVWGVLLLVYYGTRGCRRKTEERKKAVAVLRNDGAWALNKPVLT